MRYVKEALLAAGILTIGIVDPAAAAVVLGNQTWTGTGNNIDLAAVNSGTVQPGDAPCLICAGNQPGQISGFGYNDYKGTGNLTNITAFSDQGNGGRNTLQDNTFVNDLTGGYTIGDGSLFKAFLLANGDTNLNLSFRIGIDVNDTSVPQQLLGFYFLNLTDKTVLASYTCTVAPGTTCNVPSLSNGTGKADYTLSGFTLNGIDPGDEIIFAARMTGLNDGPDSFFLLPGAQVEGVPEASTWLMMLACFFGVGGLAIRRQRRERMLRIA
jgi:hypothetical protein